MSHSAPISAVAEQPQPVSELQQLGKSVPKADVVILLDGSPQSSEWQKNLHTYFARMITDIRAANPHHRIRVGVVCYSRAASEYSIHRSPILGTIPLCPPEHAFMYLKTHRAEVGIGRAACSGGMAVLDAIVAALEMFDDQIEAHNARKWLRAHENKYLFPTNKSEENPDFVDPPLPKFYLLLFAHSPTNTSVPSSHNTSKSLDGLTWDGLPNEIRKRGIHFNLVTMTHLPELRELHKKTVDKPGQSWFQLPPGHSMMTSGLQNRLPFQPDGMKRSLALDQPTATHGTSSAPAPLPDNPQPPSKRAKLNSPRPVARAPPGNLGIPPPPSPLPYLQIPIQGLIPMLHLQMDTLRVFHPACKRTSTELHSNDTTRLILAPR
ncbi:uncharacterized protein EI90DRAFT_2266245 [Cantharellus anzutake]|uniref:uncharacterized protein n=1 Tax=Cantharellus anzutake TaxID=1750568 RepID=UPI00190730C0|nr:uncharacterized protein EI90DRAFT_2266245 [Cantharellus anzutake]KAF8339659.1 hypothetical protein EI90DRAFT_2266245 [Cantharellus anzutake]